MTITLKDGYNGRNLLALPVGYILDVEELLVSVGMHVYDAYQVGVLAYDVAEASIETLDGLVGDNLWLGMPLIPEPWEPEAHEKEGY